MKALQHAVYGPGNYQSSDLVEMDYAAIARGFGCHGIRVEDPEKLSAAIREGLENTSTPTVLDCIVTRDPARMLQPDDVAATILHTLRLPERAMVSELDIRPTAP